MLTRLNIVLGLQCEPRFGLAALAEGADTMWLTTSSVGPYIACDELRMRNKSNYLSPVPLFSFTYIGA